MASCRRAGYTLLELLAVVAIVSIAAVVAIPAAQPLAEFQADAAAGEVVQAMRFARDDTRRTGKQRLFSCRPETNTVTVGGIDTDKDVAIISSTPVLHPARALPYAVKLNAAPAGNQMAIVSCLFTFADNASADAVAFDATGNPVRGVGKGPARTQLLRTGAVVVGAGHVTRTVTLDVTGRITIS